eukprot:XP_011665676.1 PREDICTED: uncharacterized protein LOC105438960 [Strongylocentrotus purpuratus]
MAEDIRDVSTISDDHQDNNATTCADEIDTVSEDIVNGFNSELVSCFVPDAFFKLFSTTSSATVENERTDGTAVSTMDDHGLQEVAGILHQSITTLDQWFYGTPEGRELQRTFLEEFPELRDPVEVGLRNLLHVLTPVLTQLQDRSHPHFQDIERWFSTYHMLVKVAVNFLHGGVVRLMKSNADKGNMSLDVSRIINELASIRVITDIGKHLCETQEGLAKLTGFFLQIPEPMRPDERAFRNLLQNLPDIVNQMKDTSNPLVQEIEQWFANSNVLIRLAVDFLHGAVMGLINNEACKELGPLDVTQIFVEVKKALHQIKISWGQLLFENPNGRVFLKTAFRELLGPMRPVDNGYRNNLQLMGDCLIQLKNSSDPLFQSLGNQSYV